MRNLVILAFALITSGSAFAAQDKSIALTTAQMDTVSAGALVNAVLVDVVDINRVQVAVPVDAAAAIGILGAAGAAAVQELGNQTQR